MTVISNPTACMARTADSRPAPGPFHPHFDFPETVAHRLLAGILGDHLRGVGRALARALKAAFAGAGPANHGAFLIRDADNRVVEAGLNVSDAMNDVLAALGLDDLQRLDVVIKRKRHLLAGAPSFLSSFFAGFLAATAGLASFG